MEVERKVGVVCVINNALVIKTMKDWGNLCIKLTKS